MGMEAGKGHFKQRTDDTLVQNYNSVLPIFLPVFSLHCLPNNTTHMTATKS